MALMQPQATQILTPVDRTIRAAQAKSHVIQTLTMYKPALLMPDYKLNKLNKDVDLQADKLSLKVCPMLSHLYQLNKGHREWHHKLKA